RLQCFLMPRAAPLFLLLVVGISWAEQQPQSARVDDPAGPNVNVSTILSAVGTPYCMKRCIGRLAFSAKKMLAFNQTTARVQDLCSAYAHTKECLDKRALCGPRNVYDAVTSGMEFTCVAKRPSFDRLEPCLKDQLDAILQTCDGQCLIRANLSTISTAQAVQMAALMNGNLLMVAKHLPPFCESIRCLLPCMLHRMNDVCPLSGWLTLDSILQPFDKAAALFAKAPPLMQQMIREQLTDKCTYLFNEKSLAEMRKGRF
ncbi:hypothetical protein PFISCL1PPCAC_527, partial [Pristionchus fissidentatus]